MGLEPVDPLAILETDVYDPFSLFNQNTCSSPYYEFVSGIYEGRVDVFNVDRDITTQCSWNVELKYERFYPGIRSVCEIHMEYTATPIEERPIVIELGEPLVVNSENQVEFAECFEGTVVGEINPVSTLELTDLVFPLQVNTLLRTDINSNRTISFPNGRGDNGINFSFSQLETSLDASGRLNLVGQSNPNSADSPWTVNITKTRSDLDE